MNELIKYLQIILSIAIGCIGSGYIGYLDREFLNSSFADKRKFINENKYKYALGYAFVIVGIILVIIYSMKLYY